MRVPIVPGGDPHLLYGDVSARAVKAILVEAFGLCNLPDTPEAGFITWIAQQRAAGVRVLLTSQCSAGDLDPGLYRSGAAALGIGAETSGRMTPEAAVTKLMLCLKYPDIPVGVPLAGES